MRQRHRGIIANAPLAVHLATEMVQSTEQLGTAWAGRGKGNHPEAWPADLRVREMPVGGMVRRESGTGPEACR